jgi:hypothetical protein
MQKHILKITVLMVGIFLFFHAQSLRAQSAGTMMSGGNIKGQTYETIIHISDITNAPIWLTNQDNPPLAIRRAEHMAANALPDSVGDISGWSSGNITLMDFGNGHWLYHIPFQGPTYQSPDKLTTWASSVTVFVTMSGEAFGPKPWPKK